MPDVRESFKNSPASHVLLSTYSFIPSGGAFRKRGLTTLAADREAPDRCGAGALAPRKSPCGADTSVRVPHFVVFSAGNSRVMNLAGCFPVLVSVCVYPPGSHFVSPDLKWPGMGPCPSTSLRISRSLTATSR